MRATTGVPWLRAARRAGALALLLVAPPAAQASEPRLVTPPSVLARAIECVDAPSGGARPGVLLVHGTNVTREENWTWSYARALTSIGFNWCAIEIPDRASGDLQSNVEYVVAGTRETFRRSGRPIVVIGASQGGMLPRWMLRFWPSTRELVGELIGVVPSNHGTTSGCEGACVPAMRQQTAGSQFLAALNRDGLETFKGIDYTNIVTRRDETVTPYDSGFLRGQARITNVATQDVCPADPFEHILTPTIDPVAWALVRDALEHDGPADARRLTLGCVQPPIPDQDAVGGAAALQSAYAAEGKVPATRTEPPLRCYALAAGCPLALRTSPARLPRGSSTRVTLTVTDEDGPVAGARVSAAGRSSVTDAIGRAFLCLRARSAVTVAVAAPDRPVKRFRLRVRP